MGRKVNEKSPLYMTILLKDEVGDPLTPSTVEWRLDDHDCVEIVAWTMIPAPTATLTVVIPGDKNLIQDETHVKERRIFGVRVNNALASEAHGEFIYNVLNLVGPSGT